ncbi:wax ester/triacylglycerol synthase domain-containing protein [Promicromonospora sp. MEB111]|uniref:wax ester/triacylglycerol synthase domain-containing protein n=1 Tax=Promicromonospora sp. MEB111 TaxID=3040301 RepID=UPI00254D4591|nr:wax ester/triacylglycerol synthase domain-containing protein [Promicromonospora sp. MEB111]
MRTSMPRLAPADEANLVLDHSGQVNVFLVAGLLTHGGFVGDDGVLDLPALRTALQSRISRLPSLRRVAVPAGRGHAWAEVPPDLEHHVRLVEAEEAVVALERRCGELMTVPLARDRPLWELLLVPGGDLTDAAFILRIHHAIADGMSAVALVHELFNPEERRTLSGDVPVDAPTDHGRSGRAGESARRVRRLGFGLRRVLTTISGRGVPPTVLLGERSPNRGVALVDVDLGALTSRARSFGATVNDALLASVAAGFEAALRAAGEQVPATLAVSSPVALRRHGSASNQVGVMLVRLPLAGTGPDDRLRLIAARTMAEKVRARQQGTLELMRGPLGARLMDGVGHRQHLVAGFVTNVPGPAETMRLAGAPITAIWPVAVLAANVRIGVAATSYAGRLRCGVHFDARNVPGAAFAAAMQNELACLDDRSRKAHFERDAS